MKLFRRDIIKKYNIRFVDNKEIFAEDYCFSLFYFAFVDEIYCIPNKSMYHYMQRSNSIMGKDIIKKNTARFEKLLNAVELFYKSTTDASFLFHFFPLIYYKVINHSIEADLKFYSNFDYSKTREIIGEIADKEKFYKNIKTAWEMRRLLYNDYFPDYHHEKKLNKLIYYYDNKKLCYLIRRIIILFKYRK